jgi:septal ring factor EnvC (AmiA/AmiB activator)
MSRLHTLAIGLVIGVVLGAGVTGYIAWRELADARADMAEARRDLDGALDSQREAEESARRLAHELAGTREALRDSRKTVERLQDRVEQFRQIIADSGEQVDALGGSLGTATEAARREQELIAELGDLIRQSRTDRKSVV